jgi:4-hydroxy-3-methylbut-2-enyl diphosphate reductase
VLEMLNAGGLDLMIVIGGYNSSNTQALAKMCASRLQTYHIDSPGCIEAGGINHRPVGTYQDAVTPGWLAEGTVRIGITAGASTPDSVVGEVIERVLALRGHSPDELTPQADIAQGSSTAAEATVDKPIFAKATAAK